MTELTASNERRVVTCLFGGDPHPISDDCQNVTDVEPAHLRPCGCLIHVDAHRVGCPEHPEGVRGNRV